MQEYTMKRFLLIFGIVSFVACAFFLLVGAIYLSGYHNLVDGTAEHYQRLHQKAIFSFVVSALLAAAGTASCILRAKR